MEEVDLLKRHNAQKSEKVQFRKDFKVVVHTSEIDIFDEQNDISYSISLWGHS